MLDRIKELDTELFLYLNNLGVESWDGFWIFITHKFGAVPLYLLLLFLMYRKLGLKKSLVVLLFIILLITASDQTCQLFKYGFKRLRPYYNTNLDNLFRLVKATGGKYSYFSAHAANITSVAVFFSLLLKNRILSIFLITWALLVAYSRIYLGVHFPLDIITGIFFGILYGTIFYWLSQFFIKRYL